MSSIGSLQIHAYNSNAQIPIPNASVIVTSTDGTGIAMRLTDRSGLIQTIEIPVPDRSESIEPNPDEKPYTQVNLYVYKPGFERIAAENIQIFPGITTYQDLEMVPLSELSGFSHEDVTYSTTPQDL